MFFSKYAEIVEGFKSEVRKSTLDPEMLSLFSLDFHLTNLISVNVVRLLVK